MRWDIVTAASATVALILAPAAAWAARFAPTTKTDTYLGWVDLDSVNGQPTERSVYEYMVFKTDQTAQDGANPPLTYSVLATKITFFCGKGHYSSSEAHLYNRDGSLVKSFEGSLVGPTIVSPQTALAKEYSVICEGDQMETFGDIPGDMTPLQFLIGVSRKILAGG